MDFHDLMGRIYGIAVIDTLGTLVVAWVLSRYTTKNALYWFVVLTLISVPVHLVFNQNTRLVSLIFFRK